MTCQMSYACESLDKGFCQVAKKKLFRDMKKCMGVDSSLVLHARVGERCLSFDAADVGAPGNGGEACCLRVAHVPVRSRCSNVPRSVPRPRSPDGAASERDRPLLRGQPSRGP